jgi:hypothetical protein
MQSRCWSCTRHRRAKGGTPPECRISARERRALRRIQRESPTSSFQNTGAVQKLSTGKLSPQNVGSWRISGPVLLGVLSILIQEEEARERQQQR